MLLKDKVAVITGSGNGIGRGIAEVFAIEEGAKVIVADRDKDQGPRVAQALRDAGGQAMFIQCDASNEESVSAMVGTTLDTHGRVDILVPNAGVNFVKPADQCTMADWDRVHQLNLRGVFLCVLTCLPHFLKQGNGNVVAIGSVHTKGSLSGAAPYTAAKQGVHGLMQSLAVEYASRHIRFNCVSPGLSDTQIWQDIQEAAEDVQACRDHFSANIPAGRVGKPHEMGHAVAFLASDKSSYTTGSNLLVDGGMTSQIVSKESYKSKAL